MINNVENTVFLTLAKNLSFIRTAKELYMSHQTVSRIIGKLEQKLGVRLFERTTRSVRLTKSGEKYYGYLLESVGRYNSMLNEIRHIADSDSCTYRIGLQQVLPLDPATISAAAILIKKNPEYWIQVVRNAPSSVVGYLLNGVCNAIVVREQHCPTSHAISVERIASVQMAVMISADYPGANEKTNWQEFDGIPFIMESMENEEKNAFNDRAVRTLARAGMSKSPIIEVSSRAMAYDMMEMAFGAVLGTYNDPVSRGRNLLAFPNGEMEHICLAWRNSESPNEKVLRKQFTRLLKQEFNRYSSGE